MTRGTFVLFTDNAVFLSTEFNGDMYFEGHGEEAAKGMKMIQTPEELEAYTMAFNKSHHHYPEEEVGIFGRGNRTYDEMLDMTEDYFGKYFSDYLFIKNASGKILTFKGKKWTGEDEEIVEYYLPDGSVGVLHFGETAEDFPPELNTFSEKELNEEIIALMDLGIGYTDALFVSEKNLKKDSIRIITDAELASGAETDAVDKGLLTKANEKYFNMKNYIEDYGKELVCDPKYLRLPSGAIAKKLS